TNKISYFCNLLELLAFAKFDLHRIANLGQALKFRGQFRFALLRRFICGVAFGMSLLQIKKLGTLGEMMLAIIAFACFGVSLLSVCGQPVHFLDRLSLVFECDLTPENRIRDTFVGEEDLVRIGCRFTIWSDFVPVL